MKLVKSNRLIKSSGKLLAYSDGYVMPITQTSDLFGCILRGTGQITIDWGDGTKNNYTLTTGADITISKTFSGYWIGKSKKINLYNSNLITSFTSTYSDGSTAFGFDLKFIPNCTYLYCVGLNTISGNLSSIPNCTYIICGGSNTISGNLSSIPKCTLLVLSGLNTISGNLSSININIQYINIGGNNTITYSTFNTRSLCLFSITNMVFTNAQENELLSSIWSNRDISKPRDERYINLATVGSPTLDATGLALKAQLQAYITPPGSTTWTILNN